MSIARILESSCRPCRVVHEYHDAYGYVVQGDDEHGPWSVELKCLDEEWEQVAWLEAFRGRLWWNLWYPSSCKVTHEDVSSAVKDFIDAWPETLAAWNEDENYALEMMWTRTGSASGRS